MMGIENFSVKQQSIDFKGYLVAGMPAASINTCKIIDLKQLGILVKYC
jgi:hypothetical protein